MRNRKCCSTCKPLLFDLMLDRLIDWAFEVNFNIGFSRVYLTRKAVDVDVFVDGIRQTDLSAYEPLGAYWEALGGKWGGRNGNVNHFYLEEK